MRIKAPTLSHFFARRAVCSRIKELDALAQGTQAIFNMSAPPTQSQQPADDSSNAYQPSINGDATSAQPSTPPKPVVAGVSKVESSTPIRVAVQNSRLSPKNTKHYVVKVNKEMDPYYVELPKFFESVFPEGQLPRNWDKICKAAA